MNRRTIELYVQANKYAQNEGLKKYDKAGDVNWKWEDTVFEKFAELIVKECCQVVRDIPIDELEPHSVILAKHFGVKE